MKRTDKVVDAKGIFIEVLLKWRIILLVAVLCFAAGTVKKYRSDSSSQDTAQPQAETETDTGDLSIDDANTQEIALIDKAIQEKRVYLYNSPARNIDPNNAGKAQITYYFHTVNDLYTINEETSDDNTDKDLTNTSGSIADSLKIYLDSSLNWSSIAQQYDVSPAGLMADLLNVKASGNALNVKVTYTNEKDAETILQFVTDALDNEISFMQEKNPDITVQKSEAVTSTGSDSDYTDWALNRFGELNDLMMRRTNLISYQTAFSSTNGSTSTAASWKDAAKSGVKYGLAGLLIMIVLLAAYYALSDKVTSADEVVNNFNLNKLTVLTRKKKNNHLYKGLDRAILNISADNRSDISDIERIQLFMDSVKENQGDSANVLVLGNFSSAYGNELKKLFSEAGFANVNVCGHIDESIDERQKLKNADAVVLAVKIGDSSMNRINSILNTVNEYHKNVIGTITA